MHDDSNRKFGMVALMGPPNAGKSTFLNHVLGQKVAIVSPKPQTTRNQISGIWTTERGQVVFLDTPGVHQLRGKMNKFLLQSAWQAVAQSNVVLVFLDAAAYAGRLEKFSSESSPLMQGLQKPGLPLIVAVNKVDKVKNKADLLSLMARIAEVWPGAEIFPISALTGDGVPELLEHVLAKLPEGTAMFPEDQISTVPMRFMAAETVREKLFIALRQELPYSTAVEIEQWEEEPERNFTRIGAVIYTSRPSHKAMIIGKQGSLLKQIGQEARLELEEMLEGKVFLELWVKVKEGWTEDPGFLRSIGLGE
ncbi:GTPase Era [Desulfocurvibacter africanus]|uniref:GTPase Era n=1 Tax=Desulfocurvibacter africanus TaxID=873 RepID=UPI00042658CB|nr:GTPase Era [Desulfocurvibacter africanus]